MPQAAPEPGRVNRTPCISARVVTGQISYGNLSSVVSAPERFTNDITGCARWQAAALGLSRLRPRNLLQAAAVGSGRSPPVYRTAKLRQLASGAMRHVGDLPCYLGTTRGIAIGPICCRKSWHNRLRLGPSPSGGLQSRSVSMDLRLRAYSAQVPSGSSPLLSNPASAPPPQTTMLSDTGGLRSS
jgi:hypothetical protein